MDSQENGLPELTEEEIYLRKAWLQFDKTDEEVITKTIDHLIFIRVENLMDNMYGHFMAFEETRKLFPDDEVLIRAKEAQTEYFRRLTKGKYDADYVRNRIKVGSTHRRIGLAPRWYFGAYLQAIGLLIPVLIKHYTNEPDRLAKAIMAFLKLIFFDMELAMDGYWGKSQK